MRPRGRRVLRILAWTLAACVAAAAVAVGLEARARAGAPRVRDVDDVAVVRDAFNARPDAVRVLALLSPT